MEHSLYVIWKVANQEGVRVLKDHPALDVPIRVVDVTVPTEPSVPCDTISLEDIAAAKNDFVYFFKFPDLPHLIEIEALGARQGRSQFIQSDYATKIDHPKLVKFLQAYEITPQTLSNGGHAHPQALAEMIERIAPKTVITLHSNHPKSQDTRGVKPYFPTKGETVSVSSIIGGEHR